MRTRKRTGMDLCGVMVVGLVLVASAALASGTQRGAEGPRVISGQAVRHDVSSPMRDLAIPAATSSGPNREVPILQRPGAMKPDPGQAPDGSLQGEDRPDPGAALTPPVDLSFSALSDDDNSTVNGFRIVPPDTNGDIGFDGSGNRVYFQYINSIWAVYDATTGAVISGPNAGNTFWAGFGGDCELNNDGDPVVLYDDDAGRWMASQFSINQGTQCVAVSTTSDPLGSYNRYAFVVTPGGANDYPKMGVWAQGAGSGANQSAYTFTTRDFGGSSGFGGSGVMERDAMLAGLPAQFVKFENPCVGGNCVEGQLPAHQAGDPPPFGTCPTFFSMVDAAYDDSPFVDDGVRNHTLCVDWNNLGNSTYSEGAFAAGVNIDRFLGNGFSDCISPVPAGGEVLDCLAAFTMYRAQYRWHGTHASVVMNTTVDAGGDRAGSHWNEMRSTDGDSGWSIFQEGTYAPADGIDRWMGSVAMDGDGNIALGYSAVSSSLNPAVRYTTRTPTSPAGVMDGGEESCVEGTGVQMSSSNRWGDYSAMSVDPSDDCTFWYTQEYYETTGSFDFNTRVCSFKLADCGMGGGGIPCEDIRRFQTRCLENTRGNLLQGRIIMNDTTHDGESVTFMVDGAPTVVEIINGKAQWSVKGAASGNHTVELTDPAGCFPLADVSCP